MEMPALFCVFLLPVFFPISPENLNIWIKSLHTYIHTYTDTHTHTYIHGTYIRERDIETERERGQRGEIKSSLRTDLELSASIELLEAVHGFLAVYDRGHSFTLLKAEIPSNITPENCQYL